MDFPRFARLAVVGCWHVTLAALCAAAEKPGDQHTLAARRHTGEINRVEIALQVGGDFQFAGKDGKTTKLPMSVVANFGYDESLLAVDAAGRPARSVRYYDDARAVIKIDKGGQKPAFAPARRLIVAEHQAKSRCLLYCPTAPLAREELELIDVPGNTLILDQTLPPAPVSLGDTWKLAHETLAALLCLDAVSWSDVECVLGTVTDGVADVSAAGPVSGATGGISTEIEVKIKYKFDLQRGRIAGFAMLVKEKRAVGHLGPGLDTVAKVIVKITPQTASKTLTAARLQALPAATTPKLLELGYVPRGGQFRFRYDRRWHVTGDEPKLAVLRLIDRGELLAQCNLSALPKVKKPITLAQFQGDVERSLGKNFGQFISASQNVNDTGYAVFRVVVRGKITQMPIEWIYYLVQDRQGHRVSLAFTLEQQLRERFADADRRVVGALQLTTPSTPTAAKPATTK